MKPEQREELKAAAIAASPGPWKGDRYDGTVKYELLDANDNAVIKGDNGNSGDGGYGITNYEDEVYLKAANPAAILSLIAQVEALTVPQWIEIAAEPPPLDTMVWLFQEDQGITLGGRVVIDGADMYCNTYDSPWIDENGVSRANTLYADPTSRPSYWQALPTIPAIPATKEDDDGRG